MTSRQRDFLAVMGHLYLTSGKPHKAETVYDALYSEFPDDREILLALAYTKLQCGEFSKAVDLADELSKGDDGEIRYDRLIKAKALWNRGDKKEARREMDRFLKTARLDDAAAPATAVRGKNSASADEVTKEVRA